MDAQLDRFAHELLESLLSLKDADTGEACPLTPREVEEVGLRLAELGRELMNELYEELTGGTDE